jgi:hypothetical protein
LLTYVSQVNGCNIANQHTATGKMNGFTDDQILNLEKELQADKQNQCFCPTAQRQPVTAK